MSEIKTRLLEGTDDSFAIERTQDYTPILEYTKGMNSIGAGNLSNDMKHAAEFPMIVVENYLARTGVSFQEFCNSQEHVKALLNDPALASFRIWEGRV